MIKKNKSKSKKAFSVAEMMVVLTVAILILSMIPYSAGIKANSKAQSLAGEVQSYKIDIVNFINQFGNLPGDFCRTDQIKSGLTNGNCNWTYEYISNTQNEMFLAWNHIANYKKYSTIYTGKSTSTSSEVASIGTNIPASGIYSNLGYQIYSNGQTIILDLANCSSGQDSNGRCYLSGIENSVMERYDIKNDDGYPLSGNVIGNNDSYLLCNNSSSTYSYTTSTTSYQYKKSKENGCVGTILFGIA